jgi:hypothetical protein
MKSDTNITFCLICWRSPAEWLHNDSFLKTATMKNFWKLHCKSLCESFSLGSLSRKVYIYYQFFSVKWCSSIWCKGIQSHHFKQYTVQYMWFLKMYLSFERFQIWLLLFIILSAVVRIKSSTTNPVIQPLCMSYPKEYKCSKWWNSNLIINWTLLILFVVFYDCWN